MSKDILALIKQGQEAKTGTTSGSLIARREENTKAEINEITAQHFSVDKLTKHRILFISSTNQEGLNKLLYNIASFNFSRFMIKDFDLVINKLDSTQNSLSVTNFESYDEAVWYQNSISTDSLMTKLLTDLQVQKVIISEENYALIKTTYQLKDYLAFQLNPPVIKQPIQIAANIPLKKQEVVPAVKTSVTQPPVNELKTEKDLSAKHVDTPTKQTAENVPLKSSEKQIDKTVAKTEPSNVQPIVSDSLQKGGKVTVVNKKEDEKIKTTQAPVVIPKQDNVPLFKGLFGYRANEPHFIAIYIVSGKIDFEKIKTAINAYNSKNYSVMNLSVSLETFEKRQVIIIGSLTDALVAKSYLIRMVKEKSLFEGLKGASYRNLLGSQKNLNVLIQQNALNQYFEFMQEYYLK